MTQEEIQMNYFPEPESCTPDDCWYSHYDNPYDIYFHSQYLSPTQKHFFWIQEWKKQVQEINEDCRKLEISSYSKDYIQGVLDAVSPEYP